MKSAALASDYDGTLARDGVMPEAAAEAIRRLTATERAALMVTGRELSELQSICPYVGLFTYVVAENGGLLYHPASNERMALTDRPAPRLLELLSERRIPYSLGETIVATWAPHEPAVREIIAELGLELQVILNKGAVMVLPAGIDKASGLRAALEVLDISPADVVAIGDAENDQALLALAGCGVAVANALPHLKECADYVTSRDHGEGVIEVINRILGTTAI
jgi:hypothetical protein